MKKINLLLILISTAVLFSCEIGMKDLYNELSEASYSVIYDANDADSATADQVPKDINEYKPGNLVTVLGNTGNLTKSGYYFSGWNTKKDGSGDTYTQGHIFTIGSSDVILYAKWSNTPVYRIFYDDNGSESGSAPGDSTYYTNGSSIAIPGNPGNLVKSGYSFTGWNTQQNGGGANYTQSSVYTVGTSDITLYANWTSMAAFGITYDKNSSNATGSVPTDTTMYLVNADVSVLNNTGNMTLTGYNFSGWNTQTDAKGTTYLPGVTFKMSEGGEILYAIWTPKQYTVTFNPQNGSVSPTSMTVTYDQTYCVTTDADTSNDVLPTPSRTGYNFGGWFTNTTYSTQVTAGTIVKITAPQTLYAKWTAKTMTVTFNPQSGSVTPTSATVTYNSAYGVLPTPTRTNYTFCGWYTGTGGTGTAVTSGTIVTSTSNHTIYAKWAYTYYVTFNINSTDQQASGSMSLQPIGSGLTEQLNNCLFTLTGYAFTGWATSPTGNVVYANRASFTMGTANVTLYAKWAKRHVVTFDKNGGTGTMYSITVYEGQTGILPKCTFSPPLFKVFKGWGGAPSSPVLFTDQGTYTYVWTTDLTLFAIWGTK